MTLADYLPVWMVKKDASAAPFMVSTSSTKMEDNPFGMRQETAMYGPFTNVPTSNNEFLDLGSFTQPITKAAKSLARLVSVESNSVAAQSESTRSWYDFSGKASDAASSIGAGIQSTLIKVIVLVVIVAVIALGGMAYIQAKGTQLAK